MPVSLLLDCSACRGSGNLPCPHCDGTGHVCSWCGESPNECECSRGQTKEEQIAALKAEFDKLKQELIDAGVDLSATEWGTLP